MATLVNQGYYQVEFTGDIALFTDGFLEFSLADLGPDAPIYADHWGVMVQFRFLKAVNIAFYYNGRQVTAEPRVGKLSLNSVPGSHYLDPVSKMLSFPIIGTDKPVRIKQLKVVSVDFGIATTFADFFEDNFIDPNAIDAAYADQVPPSYAASYDPDNGNIVKSNTFVRNLANVLKVNPSRIRVCNVVPGNRRRALREKYGWRHILSSDDDDGLGVTFEISEEDPCADVVCAHGDCNTDGACDCDSGWEGPTCNTTFVNCTLVSCCDPCCKWPCHVCLGFRVVQGSPCTFASNFHG